MNLSDMNVLNENCFLLVSYKEKFLYRFSAAFEATSRFYLNNNYLC